MWDEFQGSPWKSANYENSYANKFTQAELKSTTPFYISD